MSDAELSSLAPNLMREVAGVAARAPWARVERAAEVLLLACVAALGAWAGYKLTPHAVHEDVTAAPAVRQDDGSMIAARAPDAHPPAPRHIIPKGYTEERREAIVVTPAPAASSVEVDLSLVRNGTERRVIASSPDGQVVSAIDIPIEPALIPPASKPWAAGLAYGTDHSVGVWIERDVGRLRLGVEVAKGAGAPRAEVRVGMAF
jgi:hypothetical protein